MSTKKPTIGTIGITVGAIAFLLALLHFYAGPFAPQPNIEETIAKKAVAIRDATVAALKGQKVKEESWVSNWDADKVIHVITALMGGLAIIAGIVAFASKEPLRFAGGAAILGCSAIAFQFAALALGAIVVVIILTIVLSQLSF